MPPFFQERIEQYLIPRFDKYWTIYTVYSTIETDDPKLTELIDEHVLVSINSN